MNSWTKLGRKLAIWTKFWTKSVLLGGRKMPFWTTHIPRVRTHTSSNYGDPVVVVDSGGGHVAQSRQLVDARRHRQANCTGGRRRG